VSATRALTQSIVLDWCRNLKIFGGEGDERILLHPVGYDYGFDYLADARHECDWAILIGLLFEDWCNLDM